MQTFSKNKFAKLAVFTLLTLTTPPLTAVDAKALENEKVVVSIRPLHSLVANITDGISTPKLLLSGSSSPHTYSLKPSDAKALSNARVIFWIGPEIEGFMQKPLKSLPKNAEVVSFLSETAHDSEHKDHDKEEHTDHDKEKHTDHDKDDHKKEKHAHDPHDHEEGADPHIWLNPQDAKEIVEKAAATLIKTDPANAARYQANLKITIDRLSRLDRELMEKLKETKPLFVFHNAYSHMAERYKLNIVGVVLNNPEMTPGARQVTKIRQQLKNAKAACIFSEPQFNPKIVTTLIKGTDTKTATLDPLGSALPAGPNQYFDMMRKLATTMKHCR